MTCNAATIRDLGMENVKVSQGGQTTMPRVRLVGPDGTTVTEWGEFEGPAEIGLEVRKALGDPVYSQMQAE